MSTIPTEILSTAATEPGLDIASIKKIMDGFDPAALLPDLSDLFGSLSTLCRFAVMIGPVVLLILGLAYLFFVGGMLAAAFSFAWTAQGLHLLAAAGALSFCVSDMLIGLNVLCGFANDFVIGGVWWFYPIGQLLLLVFV